MFLTLLQSRETPIVILPTKGGFKKRKQKSYDDEIAARELRHAQIIEAFERLVEGKSPVVEAIQQEFALPQVGRSAPHIDYDKMLADIDAVERIWRAYLDADDEDILLLI